MSTSTEDVDINALVAKSLLNRAALKAKAKSWLEAELPDAAEEPETEIETAQNVDIDSDDELGGVGAPKKRQVDVLTNRTLASANDNLRKTLMGKKAYSKFQHERKNAFEASKPMPKQARRTVNNDSDEEEGKGKGRSAKGAQKRKMVQDEDNEGSRTSSKSKKRPSSYADEIIASRANKKKAKVER